MEKENIRFYILMRYKLGFDPTSIHADFVSVYGDQAHHYSTVTMWFNHSKEGEENLEDDDRVGRTKTVTTTANIELVRAVIEENPFSTYDDIQAETYLSQGDVNNIIRDCFKIRKIKSRWICHALSKKNKTNRVHIFTQNEQIQKQDLVAWR